jgi:hypothetical protein
MSDAQGHAGIPILLDIVDVTTARAVAGGLGRV